MIVGKKFALLQRISEGGIGTVYEAHDLFIGRRVALKLLHPQISRQPHVVRHFRREAKTTAAVSHPNVVTVFEMGRRRDGSFYIAQELLDGITLREHLIEHRQLDLQEAADLLLPIMSALADAHRRGIAHRDVKPDNIILARRPSGDIVPKLIDFGVAKVFASRDGRTTSKGLKVGTPAYMAPEQVRGDAAIDGRADVWAVGIVLLELLTGETPFPGPGMQDIFDQVSGESGARVAARLSELPSDLQPIVARAVELQPADRYRSMAAFRRALANYLGRPVWHPDESEDEAPVDTTWFSDDLFAPEVPEADPEPAPATDEAGPESTRGEQPWSETPTDAIAVGNPELAWARQRRALPKKAQSLAREAERALGLNALERAIERSNRVLREAVGEQRARMWLLQTVAHLWLSSYAECERVGRIAMEEFPTGSEGWYVALGHVASACGILGRTDAITTLHEQLVQQSSFEVATPARDIAACRLAIVLLRGGFGKQAAELFGRVGGFDADAGASRHSLVRAWMEVVRADLAMQSGDVAAYMRHVESSVEHFSYEGDMRNSSRQRHNVGNALLQLGAYGRAEAVFREVIDVAVPMRLNIAAPARANLGFALARLGRVEEAAEVEKYALKLCQEQGNRRFEAVAHIYLSLILGMGQDLGAAEAAARNGVQVSVGAPPLLALAKASLAGILLASGREAEALQLASEAMDLLQQLGGVEEGEAMIRLVHMSALATLQREEEARQAIAVARRRLLDRAERIGTPAWQQSFLENVPENARTLQLAAVWLDEGRSTKVRLGPKTVDGIGPQSQSE